MRMLFIRKKWLCSLRFMWQAHLVFIQHWCQSSFSFFFFNVPNNNSWLSTIFHPLKNPPTTRISFLWFMTLNLHPFCYSLRYLLRSVNFVAGERNDCLVASSFTLLSISMSFSFALALSSASLSSSSNHRAKNNWTRDDWCVLPKRKERSARTRTEFRTTVLFVGTLFLIIKHRSSGRKWMFTQ